MGFGELPPRANAATITPAGTRTTAARATHFNNAGAEPDFFRPCAGRSAGTGFSACSEPSLGRVEGKTNSWAHCRHLPFLPKSLSVNRTRQAHLGQLNKAMGHHIPQVILFDFQLKIDN